MSRNPKLQQFEFDTQPLSRNKRPQKFCDYYYNEETGAIFGRTPESWGKLVIFYIIFYFSLAALFIICMVTFRMQFINPRVPRLQQEYSIIGTSPGLGFRPMPPDVRSTLIWYKGTAYEDYEYWEKELYYFLSEYKRKGLTAGAGENIFNCGYNSPPPPGKVCDVNIDVDMFPCTFENHYNYHKSGPCVFLKLNRIYGWRPDPYDFDDLPSDMPQELKDHINITTLNNPYEGNTVWVSCEGETPADKENIGVVNYLPRRGFPGYYYPFENAEGYLSPVVAVNFVKPRSGIVINVECRAWAKNIHYNRKERLGLVHFELMVE